jgi:hypothetical protein
VILPLVAPAAIEMVCPLASVTVTGVAAAFVNVAVSTIEPPSATLGVAVRATVVASLSSVSVVVPVAAVLAVVPAVTVAVSVKVSLPSA